MQYGISRDEEYNLPKFKSHNEARKYFKDKYGDNFQLIDSDDSLDNKIYFYKLILNKEIYEDILKEINENGFSTMNEERMFCTQSVQIGENGSVHIVH